MEQLLKRYEVFLLDLWGVVWDGREIFPDAIDFCRRLHEERKSIAFVSNCAEFLAEELVERLHQAGLPQAEESWLATSGQAMQRWFQENGLSGKSVYVFGGEAVWENARRAGAKTIALPQDPAEMAEKAEADTLVIGGHHEFTWRQLQAVASCVRLGNLRIVLPNPDRVVIRQNGTVSLPPGMVAQVIQSVVPGTVVEPIGKPYPFVFDYALERLNYSGPRSKVLMIGDSLETDILGAKNASIDSLLLGQGVHQGQGIEQIKAHAKQIGAMPTYYARKLTISEDFCKVAEPAFKYLEG